ncbi:ORF2 [Plasmopara viticola lesion associated mymonavirus 1]|uniref:ORF2 n=1 Tax=Plasmopara viticola lesion associated mymonavirus 1 TaxID=2692022 RepID=A0A6B9Q503_9MONO|nr:ORF2 [Plasmopara viticola lesion associated mymonavirus 1]QHD64780.1 ORF2 [Plasmopara viticola lesion associated mymonavirus 1]
MAANTRYTLCVYENLYRLQSRVTSAVNCPQCADGTICPGHYDQIVRLRTVNPAPGEIISQDGFNFIADAWIYVSPMYTPLDATNMAVALAYLMSTPTPWPPADEDDVDSSDFLRECVVDCSERGTTAPLLLFAINLHHVPSVYRRLVYQVYLILLGEATDLDSAIKGIIWIDRIFTYLQYRNTGEVLRMAGPSFINGDLDDEGCPFRFLLHEVGLKYEVEVVFETLCYACSRSAVSCNHGDRLIDIIHSNPESRELIALTPVSAYFNRI